ncbi:MAG: DUF6152 family protein [Caulobacteraceae bacterium]
MKAKLTAIAIAALCLGAKSASAHHSFAMFALDKIVTVDAVVKDYHFAMPHVWLYTTVAGAGGPEEWGFECHSPNLVARKGWKSSSFKPGDKISIRMHPMKDGSKAGSVISVTLANGQVLRNADSDNNP